MGKKMMAVKPVSRLRYVTLTGKEIPTLSDAARKKIKRSMEARRAMDTHRPFPTPRKR